MKLITIALLLFVAHPAFEELARLRSDETRLSQERTQLAAQLDAGIHKIDVLKAREEANRAPLEAALAEAQDLARKLQTLDLRLAARRREIVATADRVIRDERDATLRAQAVQARANAAKALALPAQPSAVARALGVRESATDSAEDLWEKADLLADTEEKMRRELSLLDKKYATAQRRVELQRASRLLDSDVFLEDTRRQRADRRSQSLESTHSSGGAAPSPPPAAGGGTGTNGDFSAEPGFSSALGSAPARDVIVLKDVLDPMTLSDLSQPQDATRYLRALERARQRLREMAQDLASRSQSLRKRADELRKK